MELDEILRKYKDAPLYFYAQARFDILNWVESKLPPEKHDDTTQWNTYRQQALKNLGIEEER